MKKIAKFHNPYSEINKLLVEIRVENLIFDKKDCWVLTCRDISDIDKLTKLSLEHKML